MINGSKNLLKILWKSYNIKTKKIDRTEGK